MTIVKKNILKLTRNSSVANYSGGSSTVIINGSSTPIIDNLNSDVSNAALSARQGKILNSTKLSNTAKDTAKEEITFNKGLISNGDVRAGGFSPSTTNKGAAIFKDVNGWNIICDNAIIRKNFKVHTLLVEETKYLDSNLICSAGGFVCTNVEEYPNKYRCYFRNKDDDGNIKRNPFVLGDLAYSAIFTGTDGRVWWRLVEGIGDDYIDISRFNQLQGSAAPLAGDNVIQFGNVSLEERLNALVIWTDGICVYEGINDYIVPAPSVEMTSSGLLIKKVTADRGNIGRFAITDKGLENDVDTEGVGILDLTDKKNNVGFRVGGDTKYLTNTCYIKNNYKTTEGVVANALTCESTTGDGIVARGGRDGYGINVEGGAKIRGLYCNTSGAAVGRNIEWNEDIIFIPKTVTTDQSYTLPVPNINKAGKIFIFNNTSRRDCYLVGDSLIDNGGNPTNSFTVNSVRSLMVYTDGTKWYQFIKQA